MRCKVFRRTATSRCISRPPSWRCATSSKIATFSGDVRVKQGDTDMRCRILKVYYEREKDDGKAKAKTKTMPAATPGPGGEQHIRRLEAIGSVVVTQKEQTATGKIGIFDMKSNTVTLTGNVVMTQGKNVLRGDRLVVDLDQRRVAGGIGQERQRPGRGPVHAERGEGPGGNSPWAPLH